MAKSILKLDLWTLQYLKALVLVYFAAHIISSIFNPKLPYESQFDSLHAAI